MADADDRATTSTDDGAAVHAESDGPPRSGSQRWLDDILWQSPPSTAHLGKFRPRTQAQVPAALLDAFSDIETIRVSGLPTGAAVVNGQDQGDDTWTLATTDTADGKLGFAVTAPPAGEATTVNLTIEISGRETPGGELVSLLGGVAVAFPGARRGPLFADLPDMRQARERQEREKQQAIERDKQEQEKRRAEAAEKAKAAKAQPEKPPAKKPQSKPLQFPKASSKPATPKPATTKAATTKTTPAKPPPVKPAPSKKPMRRAAVTLQPAEKPPVPEKTAKPEAKSAPKAAPKTAAPAKPTRRAAVVLQPAESKPAPTKEAPKAPAPASPPAPPAVKAKPQPKAKAKAKAAEKPKAAPRPGRKAAVSWSKPPAPVLASAQVQPATPPPTEQSGDAQAIVIELGGAPEVGDPHFRIFADGEQVLDGNIDWGLGLPATDMEGDGLCWQSREIAWDFSDGGPDEIVLRYDHGASGGIAAGTLLARGIDVGGLHIDAEGPYARYPGGRSPWAGRGERQSWTGDLVFNVAGARRGDTDIDANTGPRAPSSTDNAPATDKQPDQAGESDDEEPVVPANANAAAITESPIADTETATSPEDERRLVLRPSAEDLKNPAVLASFADLRAHLRQPSSAIDSSMNDMLARLNFDNANWSDLLVLDPEGNPVAIDDEPAPAIAAPDTQFSPDEVDAALARLSNDIAPEAPTPEGSIAVSEALALASAGMLDDAPATAPETPALATEGPQIRDVFLAERMVRAEALRAMVRATPGAQGEKAEEAETEPPTWTPVAAEEGTRVRDSFLTAWVIRAETRDVAPITVLPAEPESTDLAPNAAIDTGSGREIGQAFLTDTLKTALLQLKSHTAGAPAPAAASSAAPSAAKARAISAGFIEDMLARATSRQASPAT